VSQLTSAPFIKSVVVTGGVGGVGVGSSPVFGFLQLENAITNKKIATILAVFINAIYGSYEQIDLSQIMFRKTVY
jgi:hypothetical protein